MTDDPQQYAAVRGYLYRRMTTKVIPLNDIVTFMRKRFPLISEKDVAYLVETALSRTRATRTERAA